MTTDGWSFADTAAKLVREISEGQRAPIHGAASLLADAIVAGGVVQAFGTGHSRIVTLELAGRAGGLVPVSMLAVKDLVMFGGAKPHEIIDPTSERDPALAQRILDLADIRSEDAFIIVSNSGINGSVIEMARTIKERGHPLIAITSVAHSGATDSRNGGAKLADFADVVIDNLAPVGDASTDLGDGVRIGSVSSLTGVLIAQLLVEQICRDLRERGVAVPVYRSANVPGGDEHNAELLHRFTGRVRPIEP